MSETSQRRGALLGAARQEKLRRTVRRTIAMGVVTALGATLAAPVAFGDTPGAIEEAEFAEEVIYQRGDDGYFCFRIPAIVETEEGALLAFAEARRDTCGDSGDIDTVVRRSDDQGATWGPIEVVHDAGGDTAGNPTPVVDAETGRIALITTHNPATNHNLRTPYLQYSEDDGHTWSDPEDIGEDISDPDWQKWLATGPGAGIQLTSGPHAGRMVIGMNHEGYLLNEEDDHYSGANLAYSDDGGLSWERGAIDQPPPGYLKPQELSLAELSDGRILISARDQHGSAEGSRAFATSSDGGETFDGSFETDPEVYAPVSQGAITSFVDSSGEDRVLFTGGSHPRARVVMSVRSSFDGGESWQTWDEGRVVTWGNAGYSDITALSDGSLGMTYETGEEDAYREIRFARFNPAYLDAPNEEAPGIIEHPPGPRTPDLSPRENTAYVRGEPHAVEGVHGNALEFDLAPGDGEFDDRVDVPYSPDIDLDDEDFTISTWFRYGEESHNQTLVWAYHMGSGLPGLWVRLEPEQNRIRAQLGTETGDTSIQSSESYDDGEWHHLAFTRDEDTVRLWVDGEVVAEDDAPAGSITKGGELLGIDGVFLGQRLDGVHRLAGAMDDVRIYDVSLSESDIAALADGGYELEADGNLRLHLPLDEVDDGGEVSPSTWAVAPNSIAGREANAWGTVDGQASVSTQVRLPNGAWATSQTRETREDGTYVIPLTYGRDSAGTIEWRVRIAHSSGTVEYGEPMSQTRLAATTATAASTTASGREASAWGTAGSEATVASQVRLPDGAWATSQLRRTESSGAYVIPLTYGRNSAGPLEWRIRVEHDNGLVEYTEGFAQTRIGRPTAASAGEKPVGDPSYVWGRVDAPAGSQVFSQVYVDGHWRTSQAGPAAADGDYRLELTYGANLAGTSRWRVGVLHPDLGTLYSDAFSFVRTTR